MRRAINNDGVSKTVLVGVISPNRLMRVADVSSIDSGLHGEPAKLEQANKRRCLTYRFYKYKPTIFIACQISTKTGRMPANTRWPQRSRMPMENGSVK